MRKIVSGIKGIVTMTVLATLTVSTAILILIVFGITCIIPFANFRHLTQRHLLHRLPVWYMFLCRKTLLLSTRGLWDVQGTDNLKQNGWYLMISNHQSWVDILILGTVFNYVVPPLKFFMKKELLWQLPFAGLACYALGYPFVARHTHADIKKNPKLKGKDIETTIKACHELEKHPATLINFVEGTRFTDKKYKRQNSPFNNLLKPRAGGLSIALQALHKTLDGIINVTILFPGKKPTIWEFACGDFKKVVVRYDLIQITDQLIGDYQNDRNFRATFQQWLNIVWGKNDALIDKLIKHYE